MFSPLFFPLLVVGWRVSNLTPFLRRFFLLANMESYQDFPLPCCSRFKVYSKLTTSCFAIPRWTQFVPLPMAACFTAGFVNCKAHFYMKPLERSPGVLNSPPRLLPQDLILAFFLQRIFIGYPPLRIEPPPPTIADVRQDTAHTYFFFRHLFF